MYWLTAGERMQITDVTAFPVEMPLKPIEDGGCAPYVTNHSALSSKQRVLVRVDTDEGVSGWGEVRPLLSATATAAMIEDGVGDTVTGKSPFELESFRRQVFVEYANMDVYFAPVETACWDIVGKVLDRPVFELLGGWTAPVQTERKHKRQHTDDADSVAPVEVAYCLGIFSPEESARYAERVLGEGYTVLKTKAGRDWREDVDRIVAMHEATDGDLEFRLDPNQGWTLDEAVRVGASLADAGIYLQYMEQPIRVDTHESLAKLRERTPQPIAPNEDCYIPHNIRRMANIGAADVAVVDLTPAGGITGLRQQVGVAEDAGLGVTHHCAFDLGIRTAAILHAVTGIPGFTHPPDSVYYGWDDDVIVDPFTVEDGALSLPDGAGLGVTVDEAKIAEYRVD